MADSTWVTTSIKEDECVTVNNITVTISPYDGKKQRTKKITFTQCEVGDDETQPIPTITEYHITQMPPDVIVIPPSDYMVFRYFWGADDGRDLDTATEFLNTGIENVDDQPVGFSMRGNNNPIIIGNTTTEPPTPGLLIWAGDNMQSGNECVYINFKYLFEAYEDVLPQSTQIGIWATWFGQIKSGNMTFEITTYSGGMMVKDGYNFVNEGGSQQFRQTYSYNVNTKKGSSDYKNQYTRIGTVYIDKDSKQITMILGNP